MRARSISIVSLQRLAASGFVCWLLLGSAAPAAAHERHSHARTCEAPKKNKSSGARAGRKDKSKSSSQAQESSSSESGSSSSSSSDDADDLSGLDDVAPAPKRAEPAPKPEPIAPVRAAREEPAATSTDSSASDDASAAQADAETAGELADGDVESAPQNAADADSGPSVVIDAYAGFGIATRSVHMPMPMMTTGVLELEPGLTPAAEVGLRVTSHPNAPFSFYVHLIYQSALGFSVTEHPPLALPKDVRARSERVALEFAPRWHIASSKLDVAIPIGATVRSLWAEVHTSETPSFSLVGPHLRVEAILALTDMISVRLSPELHYIVMVDADLRTASVSSTGPAIGGDASLDVRLSRTWSLGINYRESHALLSASRGDGSFRDVERYLTLRATGSF